MAEWNDEYQLNPIDVIPSKQRWKIQWERLERWFNRVSEIKNKGKEKPLTPYDIDILIAFCQNCFQLREWIETSNPDLTKSINVLFEQNFELKGCRDICHGYEHKEIDPFQKIGEPGDSEKLKNYYNINL